METTPIPEPPKNTEIYQVGEKLTQLIDPINMARDRLDTLYEKKLYETMWGYWERPDFTVSADSDPEHPFEVSFKMSDPQGSTRRMAIVKHNGNEVWMSFPNTFSWIDRTRAETGAMEAGEEKEEIGELVEGMKSIKVRESDRESLIQVTASPVWNATDGPHIKKGFRLSYLSSQDGGVKYPFSPTSF